MARLLNCIRLGVVFGLMLLAASLSGQSEGKAPQSAATLVEQFGSSKIFWQQFEVAKKIVALHDVSALPSIGRWLNDDDRHVRGNAAFILASFGDEYGFKIIREMLADRSNRPETEGIPNGRWTLQGQIVSDRYYAVHLFGELRDPKAVPILIPLLHDEEVNYTVPWALGEIGDQRAIKPLIDTLSDKSPTMRVLAILGLQELKARESLPRLYDLLNDQERCNFGQLVSVAEAAKSAIATLEKE